MESIHITTLRTGAASAVAAKYLARKDAHTVAICGCGVQGQIQLEAISLVRKIERVFAWDVDAPMSERFAAMMTKEVGVPVTSISDLSDAKAADIWITCTPSTKPFLTEEHVSAGAFIAAVGSDSEEKQELSPDLIAQSKLVTDVTAQCATIGELHHALAAGKMTAPQVHAELAEVVAGTRPPRESAKEITIFDSTGMALQDVAAAAAVYQCAVENRVGLEIDLFK